VGMRYRFFMAQPPLALWQTGIPFLPRNM